MVASLIQREIAALLLLVIWVLALRSLVRRLGGLLGEEDGRTIGLLAWDGLGRIILFGLPIAFALDGLVVRLGLLYSPALSFFNPFDTYLQILGVVLSISGLSLITTADRVIARQVYGREKDERRLIRSGVYAYIRHPYYLGAVLVPLGLLLVSLNFLFVLLPMPFLFFTDGEVEAWTGKRSLTFIARAIGYEEEDLLRKFGEDYERYSEDTARFVPKIRRKKREAG